MAFDDSRRRKIILVDDDPVNIQICKMMLVRTIPNIEFTIFPNGLSAIEWISDSEEIISNGEAMILLLDLNMPVLNGWGFLDYFVKFSNQLKSKFSLFILSSSIDPIDIERAKYFPAVRHFYTKPLNNSSIRDIFSLADSPAES